MTQNWTDIERDFITQEKGGIEESLKEKKRRQNRCPYFLRLYTGRRVDREARIEKEGPERERRTRHLVVNLD